MLYAIIVPLAWVIWHLGFAIKVVGRENLPKDGRGFVLAPNHLSAIDPVFVVLPNSGLLVRYNMLLGLNADGTPNQEAGTTPDLLSPAGEHPLITALRAILS